MLPTWQFLVCFGVSDSVFARSGAQSKTGQCNKQEAALHVPCVPPAFYKICHRQAETLDLFQKYPGWSGPDKMSLTLIFFVLYIESTYLLPLQRLG
jgi:hypothetical protein